MGVWRNGALRPCRRATPFYGDAAGSDCPAAQIEHSQGGGNGYRANVELVEFSGNDTPDYQRAESQHRSEEHTSELQSLMRISYAVFCLKKTKTTYLHNTSQYPLKVS